jgi:hypothetical protein
MNYFIRYNFEFDFIHLISMKMMDNTDKFKAIHTLKIVDGLLLNIHPSITKLESLTHLNISRNRYI